MLPLKKDIEGNILPIKNKNIEKVCRPHELIFFFKHCFSLKERKFKMILLAQLGCECRISEACAINLNDFHKGSEYRKVDMLMNKKVKNINGKIKGKNVIVTKTIPEAIAAHLRAWVSDNWNFILQNQGYIFPSNHMEKNLPYCNPRTVTIWFSSKRKQLTKLFPDKGFDRIIGWRVYKDGINKLSGRSPFYLWSTHMFKRFAGTFAYLMTKDPIFTKELLCHEKLETTQKHYIDSASVLTNNSVEKVKNKLFNVSFYEGIKRDDEEIPAVWERIKQ